MPGDRTSSCWRCRAAACPSASRSPAALRAPLDVFLVRKLGVPGHAELAMGAIAAGGIEVLSDGPHPRARHSARARAAGRRARAAGARAARPRVPWRPAAARRPRSHRHPRRRRTGDRIDDAGGGRWRCGSRRPRASSSPCRSARARRASGSAGLPTRSSAPRCPSRSTRSASGTRSSRRRPTTRSRGCSPRRRGRRTSRRLEPVPAPIGRVRWTSCAGAREPLSGDPSQYDALIDGIGDARLVLLGEASHGTHEFYRERAFITRRLIDEKGFAGVAVEADWPDAYRVNRYVRGTGADEDAVEALARLPAVPDLDVAQRRRARFRRLAARAQRHAARRPSAPASTASTSTACARRWRRCSPTSTRSIPRRRARARARYACFDQFGEELQDYGYAAEPRPRPLVRARSRRAAARAAPPPRPSTRSRDGRVAADEFFFAEQNARARRNAEEYYRTMFRGRVDSWNLRDRHMAETLDALLAFLDRARPARALVVWAHNSHLGDARATEMGEQRRAERRPARARAVRRRGGARRLHDLHGTVTAATEWDGPAAPQARAPGAGGQLREAVPRRRHAALPACRCAPISSWRRRSPARGSSARSA